MQDKRYQVFISSTFNDLREERRAVQDAIISMGDFPVQMESFPAADESQLSFIKTLIDKCDYYVLIIGGKYGSISANGLSYTHEEFRYALSQKVPVLVMNHGDRGNITVDRFESTQDGRDRLATFVDEARDGRLSKDWTSIDGLKLAVREALDHAKATISRTGWVRGDSITSIETLGELNEVRKENDRFREKIGNLAIELDYPNIPSPEARLSVKLLPATIKTSTGKKEGSYAIIEASWIGLFPIFHMNLKWHNGMSNNAWTYDIDEEGSCLTIGSALAGELADFDTEGLFKISLATLDLLMSYYIEAGLMSVDTETPFSDAALTYSRRHRISAAMGSIELLSGAISSDHRKAPSEFPF